MPLEHLPATTTVEDVDVFANDTTDRISADPIATSATRRALWCPFLPIFIMVI